MTDMWSDRAEAYRQSPIHAVGEDLDLIVAWCEPAAGVDVLDVATGGGHVARKLREAMRTHHVRLNIRRRVPLPMPEELEPPSAKQRRRARSPATLVG